MNKTWKDQSKVDWIIKNIAHSKKKKKKFPEKSTKEILEQGTIYVQSNNKDIRRCSAISIVNFEHISHVILMSLLLTLNK